MVLYSKNILNIYQGLQMTEIPSSDDQQLDEGMTPSTRLKELISAVHCETWTVQLLTLVMVAVLTMFASIPIAF